MVKYVQQKIDGSSNTASPEDALSLLQVGGSGKVTLDSLRHLLCNYEEAFTEDEFDELVRSMKLQPEFSYKQFVSRLLES